MDIVLIVTFETVMRKGKVCLNSCSKIIVVSRFHGGVLFTPLIIDLLIASFENMLLKEFSVTDVV